MTDRTKAILTALNDLVSIVDDTPWDLPMLVEHYETVEKESPYGSLIKAAEEIEKTEVAFNASNNYRPCINGEIMRHAGQIARQLARAELPKINEPLTYLLRRIDAEMATAILDSPETQIRAVNKLQDELESRGIEIDYKTVEEYAIAIAKQLFNDIDNETEND